MSLAAMIAVLCCATAGAVSVTTSGPQVHAFVVEHGSGHLPARVKQVANEHAARLSSTPQQVLLRRPEAIESELQRMNLPPPAA
jgi:hypothetical protein